MKTIVKYLMTVAIPLISCAGCQEDDLKATKISDGIYVGTFVRDAIWVDDENIANITITFSSNTWTGASDIIKYPALCNGTYSINGDKIIFENDCAWTAEFDWSLILSGEYDIKEINDNSIEFHRDYRSETSDTFVDIYKIYRQLK